MRKFARYIILFVTFVAILPTLAQSDEYLVFKVSTADENELVTLNLNTGVFEEVREITDSYVSLFQTVWKFLRPRANPSVYPAGATMTSSAAPSIDGHTLYAIGYTFEQDGYRKAGTLFFDEDLLVIHDLPHECSISGSQGSEYAVTCLILQVQVVGNSSLRDYLNYRLIENVEHIIFIGDIVTGEMEELVRYVDADEYNYNTFVYWDNDQIKWLELSDEGNYRIDGKQTLINSGYFPIGSMLGQPIFYSSRYHRLLRPPDSYEEVVSAAIVGDYVILLRENGSLEIYDQEHVLVKTIRYTPFIRIYSSD